MEAEGGPGDTGAARKGQAGGRAGERDRNNETEKERKRERERERERARERERDGGGDGGRKTERNRSCALCIFIRPAEKGRAGRGTLVHANRQLGYWRRGEVARRGLNPCEISRPPALSAIPRKFLYAAVTRHARIHRAYGWSVLYD